MHRVLFYDFGRLMIQQRRLGCRYLFILEENEWRVGTSRRGGRSSAGWEKQPGGEGADARVGAFGRCRSPSRVS